MFVWRDDADDATKEGVLDQVRQLESDSNVELLTIGQNIGKLATDFDWIVDLQVADKAAASALIEGGLYGEVMTAVAPATKYEWTARITHEMRGI
jgi:hypothetical protein